MERRQPMTTPAAEKLYRAQHEYEMEGKGNALYNPHNKPFSDLPTIYGFNNGGSAGWYHAVLLAEDGTCLGGHVCSHECYMKHDLGILEGTSPDRHETFKQHYPDGYKMVFVPSDDISTHEGLQKAFTKNKEQEEASDGQGN
jgi:hypothetical protein